MLEIFSFIYLYPSAIIGPSFEFADFKNFIELKGDYKNINYKECNKYTGRDLFFTFNAIIIFLALPDFKDISYLGSEEYGNKNMIYKIAYYLFAAIVLRMKYYIGFNFTIASCTFCGLNYQEKDYESKEVKDKRKFEKIRSVIIYIIELSIDMKTTIGV